MPRKPAGTVRRQHPPLARRDDSLNDAQGVSSRTLAEIRKLELAHDDLYRGAVRRYLSKWRIEACGPPCREQDDGQCREWYSYDDGHWEREQLTAVLRRLPGTAARELRRLVRKIDEHHLSGCPGWRDCRWGRSTRAPLVFLGSGHAA